LHDKYGVMPPDPDEYLIVDLHSGLDHKAGPWNGQPLDHFAYYLAGILTQHLVPKWATMPEDLIKDAVTKAISESTRPGGHNMPRGEMMDTDALRLNMDMAGSALRLAETAYETAKNEYADALAKALGVAIGSKVTNWRGMKYLVHSFGIDRNGGLTVSGTRAKKDGTPSKHQTEQVYEWVAGWPEEIG
jgi:hypothetical protein